MNIRMGSLYLGDEVRITSLTRLGARVGQNTKLLSAVGDEVKKEKQN